MSSPAVQASVIICAYTEDRWNDLIAAVDSVRHQSTPPGEIILVIDYNQALYHKAFNQFSDISVIENIHSRGLSGARNTGAELAKYLVVAFMDEDATADKEWLSRLLPIYQDHDVIGVGGTVEPVWLGRRPTWFPDEFKWVVGCSYKGIPEEIAPVRNMLGCNMSFRRDVFTQTGGFRDELGRLGGKRLVSCEETEFCIRVNQNYPKSRILHEPHAQVNHRVPAKRTTWNYYWSRCFAEGQSKALVASFVGNRDGLASERSYSMKTLPSGITTGLKESIRKRNLVGISQAGAIFAGLLITTLGYITGKITYRPIKTSASMLKIK